MNKPSVIAIEEQEQPARFTAEEFMAMSGSGAFEEFVGKIELVEGVIVRMSPPIIRISTASGSSFSRCTISSAGDWMDGSWARSRRFGWAT